MSNSTHKCEVVEVNLEPIEGADKVALARIDGYTCVTQKDQWEGKKLGIFCPPDTLVPVDRTEFSFLKDTAKEGFARIKAKKIRKCLSFGLLVPAPEGAILGEDWAEKLGTKHYDPFQAQAHTKGVKGLSDGQDCSGPNIYCPKYDLEAGQKYGKLIEKGEPVLIEEKMEGENWFAINLGGKIHVRSRTIWKREYPNFDDITREKLEENKELSAEKIDETLAKVEYKKKNNARSKWWQALYDTPNLLSFLLNNPNLGVFGELINTKSGFDYGVPKNQVRVFPFDMMELDGVFWDAPKMVEECLKNGLETPYLYNKVNNGIIEPIPFDMDYVASLAEGKTMHNAKHVKEGVIVSTWQESVRNGFRMKLKWKGASYFERSSDDVYEEEE